MSTNIEKNLSSVFGVYRTIHFSWCQTMIHWVRFSIGSKPMKDSYNLELGWPGVAKVSCILRHRGLQLILAYSWARLAILVAGNRRGESFYFFCFFPLIPVRLSSLPLCFISSTISFISSLPYSGRRHKMTHKGWRVVKPQHNQI